MSLRQLVLQARRRCLPRTPQLPGLLLLFRVLSTHPSKASTAPPQRRSPFVQVRLPQSSPPCSSDLLGSGFHIDVVDFDLWTVSYGFSSESGQGNEFLDDEYRDGLNRHGDEEVNFNDEINDMRHRKKLFYKLDRQSKDYEENNMSLRRTKDRDKANAKNLKECIKVECAKSVSSNAPKPQEKHAVRDDMVEVKWERMPTFNQMTAPYHHPFCLDIHVTKGSVCACFVHRVTSRVVAVAHSISKDMKFDLGSRKGKGMKACASVGALLAKRALEDDIHNALFTPRKGERIEGKIEVVLRAIIENGVDVKLKLKERKPIKNTLAVQHDRSPGSSTIAQHNS